MTRQRTVRRLIINADDLGMTPGVNRGILDGHTQGVITSVSLMPCAESFEDAVTLLRSGPRLSVGCHVTLTCSVPVLSAPELPQLTSRGRLRGNPADVVQRALRGRIPAAELEAEMTAQIRRIQATGLHVTHVDTHQHLHLFPAILRPLLAAARACGVRGVRNPFTPLQPMAIAHFLRRVRVSAHTPLRLAEHFQRLAAEAGLVTPDGTVIMLNARGPSEKLFDALVGCLPEGTWELACHPGYYDGHLQRARTSRRKPRAKELEVLMSEGARASLERHGIELISYRELANSESPRPPATSKGAAFHPLQGHA